MYNLIKHLFGILAVLLAGLPLAQAETNILTEIQTRNDHGTVHCSLFQSKEGFPNDTKKAVAQTTGKPIEKQAKCEFKNLPVGEYAVSVFHDEKESGKLEFNLFGIPKQGVGASNDPSLRHGPPSFESARFKVEEKPLTLAIQVRY
jgi:uncharacterized protein (DUF2141 family)